MPGKDFGQTFPRRKWEEAPQSLWQFLVAMWKDLSMAFMPSLSVFRCVYLMLVSVNILNTALCYCFPFFEMLLSHYRISLVMKNTEICDGHFQLSLEFNSLGPSVAELLRS